MSGRRGRGCGFGLVLAIFLVGMTWGMLYPFLARQVPVVSDVVVIEGWMKDDLLVQAAGWAESNGVKKIFTTGGPIELGSWLAEWKSYAELSKVRLEKKGFGEKFEIVAVPAEKVRRGRTRASARALKAAMGMERGSFNLISEGPHMRRSWRSFQGIFGDGVEVGCWALTPVEYDRTDWWSCSEGVRDVIAETIAYGYDVVAGGREGEGIKN